MDILRLYLIVGLLLHKAVWEVLKRRRPPAGLSAKRPLRTTLVKTVKVAILLGVLAQTALPWDVLPIAGDPAPLRVIGAVLYSVGLAIALLARLELGRNWSDIEAAGVLPDQSVVATGVYRYVRHPIYTGDLLMLAGLELALNSWAALLILLMAPVVLMQAVREERMLMRALPGYDAYCRRTKRFLPFLV